MTLHKGDRVLVNVAPFIASPRRNRAAVPCDVLEVDAVRVLVSTRSPCRTVELWVEEHWIEEVLRHGEPRERPSGSTAQLRTR